MTLIIYGDFTELLSLVASLRADALIAQGHQVQWRAVVGRPSTTVVSRPRSDAGRSEIAQAATTWRESARPGEPGSLARQAPGFVPYAGAAAAAYAEGVGAGIGDHVRYLLFESYWREHEDIGNPDVLRRLLTIPVLHAGAQSDVLREYGYAVSIAGGPVTSEAWRLRHSWEVAFRGLDRAALPVVTNEEDVYSGEEAIRFLGTLGEEPHTLPATNPYPLPPMPTAARRHDVFRHGGRPIWRDR